MRSGGTPLAVLLLVLVATVLKVSANDIYWEGEEDASNEFLEVKHEDSSFLGGLTRTKRQWFDTPWWLSPKKEEEAETVTEADPNDNGSYGKDDDLDVGSGAPDKTELEPKEKTLRVTFLVMEPYITEYSNRDSPEFLNISRSLANAVDLLFESLPGTQRSSLVRIQSLVNDDFLCKVTLDIVTTRNEDTDTIKEILRNHIKNNGRLGETSVRDGDFSAQLIDPGTTFECDENEFTCDDNICLPLSVKCDKRADCKDGTDELGCPDTIESTTAKETVPDDIYDDRDDTFDNQNNDDQYSAPPDYQTGDGVTFAYDSGVGVSAALPTSTTTITPVNYDQEYNRGDLGNADSSIGNTEAPTTRPPESSPLVPATAPIPAFACPATYIRCDVMRCVEPNRICDGASDCNDGTDEANCPDRTCGDDDFHCRSGACIESSRRCDNIYDCPDHDDELGCDCRPDEFRCSTDGNCIEERKKCDGVQHCADGSDELDCRSSCPPDSFTCNPGSRVLCAGKCNGNPECDGGEDEEGCEACEHECDGRCLPTTDICNGIRDCSDGSDEDNCYHCDRPDDFRCDNDECIQYSLRCNGIAECLDGSDEKNCNKTMITSPEQQCTSEQFKCLSDNTCIDMNFLCDYHVDCEDGSDEANCPCPEDSYQCYNGQCMSTSLFCDGHVDCQDGSDELNCPESTTVRLPVTPPVYYPSTTRYPSRVQPVNSQGVCSAHQWRCENGPCIDAYRRCDGHIDCPFDYSDEFDCPRNSKKSNDD